VGVTEQHIVSSDTLLLVWHMLAPSTPQGGWDASSLLDLVECPIGDPFVQGMLTTLEKYRLARFEPEFTAWCRNHPLMGQRPKKPPVLRWQLSPEHLDVWWHLQHPDSVRAWCIEQARERCAGWSTQRLHDLQEAGLAKGVVRVASR
jgi:hypothetical protein